MTKRVQYCAIICKQNQKKISGSFELSKHTSPITKHKATSKIRAIKTKFYKMKNADKRLYEFA